MSASRAMLGAMDSGYFDGAAYDPETVRFFDVAHEGGNGVEVTGEVQVDVFHWDDLRVTAASGTTLDAQSWASG